MYLHRLPLFLNKLILRRKKAELYINAWLKDFLGDKTSDDQLFEIMNSASAIAKKNGLTTEKLDELLKDEAQLFCC